MLKNVGLPGAINIQTLRAYSYPIKNLLIIRPEGASDNSQGQRPWYNT